MSEIKDIESFDRLQRLINIFQKVNQLSWTANQAKRRYPAPELMNPEEMIALTRLYLSLGMDLEDLYKDWKETYKEYKNA